MVGKQNKKHDPTQPNPTLALALALTDVQPGPWWPTNGHELGCDSFVLRTLRAPLHQVDAGEIISATPMIPYHDIASPIDVWTRPRACS